MQLEKGKGVGGGGGGGGFEITIKELEALGINYL